MNNKTEIQWCDATWNPVTGCTKVSEGCRNCYAEGIANRFWGERKFTDVLCHAERLNQPSKLKKPSRIFVNSMSDLFHSDVPDKFIREVLDVCFLNPQHTFIILTKRPKRMMDIFLNASMWHGKPNMKWNIPNVWLGVSVENQKAADERIPLLLQTPAAVRFVSCEPLLGPVNLRLMGTIPCSVPYSVTYQKLHWIICGGESGPRARPMHPDWARSLRDQCQDANVPFFFKQWGEWAPDCLCDTKNPHPTTPRPQPGFMGCMFRCGKNNAGRMLDGREWDEFPGEEE